MSRGEFKNNVRKGNEEVKKIIKPNSQANKLQERKGSILREEELMELSTNKRRIGVGIVTFVIILVVGGLLYFIYPKKEQGPAPTTTKQQIQEEAVEEAAVEEQQDAPVEEEVVAPDEWINSLDITEIKYCLWNQATGEGIVLENNETYQMKENDIILIYKPKGDDLATMTLPEGAILNDVEVNERYNILDLKCEGEMVFLTILKSTSGIRYEFNFTVNSYLETAESNISDSETTKTDFSEIAGEEWVANFIESPNPEYVVWNDITGTKKEITNGEEYQYQEGDVIAVYYGENYIIQLLEPWEMISVLQSKYAKLNYTPNGSAVEIKAQFKNIEDDEDVIDISFTLLP